MADRVAAAIGPASGSEPTQPITALSESYSIKLTLHDGPEISFGMPGRSVAALNTSGLATDVWLYKLGDPWQRFRVLPITQTWTEDGDDTVRITAIGYKRVVYTRHIITGPPTFTNVDQGLIIWQLIQHTQGQPGGDLGISAGVILNGQPRDRVEYKIGDNFGKIIGDLENVINGPWWDIDVDLVMSSVLADDFPLRTRPIVLGDNARSITAAPGAGFGNVSGAVGSPLETTVEWRSAPTVTTDPRGRWEVFDASHGSVTDQDTVVEYAEGNLAAALDPPTTWTAVLEPARYFGGDSQYEPGDFVRMSVPASIVDPVDAAPPNVLVQLTEIAVTADENGEVAVTATGVEVDE